jgi:psiF repeat
MLRYAAAAVMVAVLLPATPSFAVTAKEKMATCKFGADDQKLTGAARSKFMKKCMLNKDEPRGAPMAPPPGAPPPPPPPQH